MKRYFFIFFLVLSLFSFPSGCPAQEEIEVNFFYSQTCPHCAAEKNFLEKIEEKYPQVKVNKLLFSENIPFLQELYQNYEIPQNLHGWVPVTFIGNKYFLGFDEQTEKDIEDCILTKIETGADEPCEEENSSGPYADKEITLPLIGKIDPSRYSLIGLSVVFGFFDGFNVCSLGALVLILGLVLAFRQRKKIIFYGGIFILTTALVYALLIFLWHQIFSLLTAHLRTMEIIIGLLGICGGLYFFREFIRFKKRGPTCNISAGSKITDKFFPKIQNFLESSKSPLLIIGCVFSFAAIITIVEFPCSTAVPVVFAGILAKAHLSLFGYLFYIAVFTAFYMIDEIIVFFLALFTMNIKIASPSFTVWLTLLEAAILLLLGIYYLFGFGILI